MGSKSLLPALIAGEYAPGAIRNVTDRELASIAGFLHQHPEYERLGHAGVLALASVYLDDADREERDMLTAEGVPLVLGLDEVDGDEEGFTLIEVLIVLSICGILATLAIGGLSGLQSNAAMSFGPNGIIEARCINGYQFVVGADGGARQVLDEHGKGAKCEGRQ
jgi:prepilin-type N-terminal cleavage/methylation domain-containing protein